MLLMEELSMNAWPSLRTMMYDGWVIRLSNGYSRRANSVYPLYKKEPQTSGPSNHFIERTLEQKIEYCENLYRENNIKPSFKITDASQPNNLDLVLAARGYGKQAETQVMLYDLSSDHQENRQPEIRTIRVYEAMSGEWLNEFCRLNKVRESDRHTLGTMMLAIVPKRFFVSLVQGNQVVACGLTVIEDGFAGIFDVVVDESLRGTGLGKQIMLHLLNIAKHAGAKKAYLQVMENNSVAESLYRHLGFEEGYRYWYRVLE